MSYDPISAEIAELILGRRLAGLEPLTPESLLKSLRARISPMIDNAVLGETGPAHYRLCIVMWSELSQEIRTEVLCQAQKFVTERIPAKLRIELYDQAEAIATQRREREALVLSALKYAKLDP